VSQHRDRLVNLCDGFRVLTEAPAAAATNILAAILDLRLA
jgi:hypothetical protein